MYYISIYQYDFDGNFCKKYLANPFFGHQAAPQLLDSRKTAWFDSLDKVGDVAKELLVRGYIVKMWRINDN